MIPPKTIDVLGDMVRAGRRNRRVIPHLVKVLGRFTGRYIALLVRRLTAPGRRTVALALLEHMGDIVGAEPISRYARRQYPTAKLFWIVRKPYAAIVANFREIDEVLSVHCMTEWLLLWSSGIFAMAWDLHISERPCGHCGIFYKKPGSAGELTYRTYYNYGNLLTVNCLVAGIPVIDDAPILTPGLPERSKVDGLGLPARYVAVHGKSNEDNRDWDLSKWRQLIAWIVAETGMNVIEIGTKPYLIQQQGGHTSGLCGELSILETAEVIRRAALFIGIDSGPAHLANAVATPGVVLLGRYQNFAEYTPYSGGYGTGENAGLLRADGPAATIPLSDVKAAVARRLATSPPTKPVPEPN